MKTILQYKIDTKSPLLEDLSIVKKKSLFSYVPKKEENKTVVETKSHQVIGEYKLIHTPDHTGVIRIYYQKTVGTNT